MTTPANPPVFRLVSNTHGTWDVVHSFTGRVEFSTSDRPLAEEVRERFDMRDPLSSTWVYETAFALPPAIRQRSVWVMSTATSKRMRFLKGPDGAYMFVPSLTLDGPEGYLLGLPVLLDDSAVGVMLRDRTAA